jgi:hypothetical protein
MANSDSPKVIELKAQDLEELFSRLESNRLTQDDQYIIKNVFRFCLWLQQKLEAGKFTVNILRRLLFGHRSEKRSKTSAKGEKNTGSPGSSSSSGVGAESSTDQVPSPSNLISFSEKAALKGHGRLGSNSYPEAEEVVISHGILKSGDSCPQTCGGCLYDIEPGVFISITGQQFAKATRYQLAKLRCGSCGLVVKAELPEGVDRKKYDSVFKAILAVQKYFVAVPFYRQEQFQKLLNFPLPDSTQWDLIEQVADSVYPVIRELESLSSQGEIVHSDDTPVRIMEVIKANKADPTRQRTGMFTSGIVSKVGSREIALYYSGTQHAGENLSSILSKRPEDLSPIIHMCDALKANLTPEFKTILFHCLAHGRRKFTDIEIFFPKECAFVIDQLAKVYFHDAQTKEQGLSPEDRLLYHQKYSAPVMGDLKKWLDLHIDNNLVEPNGGLGKAIMYLLNHWEELTKFLHVAGGPLDNNIVERSLKIPIRIRKNSLIHRSCHGAHVSSILMSLIQTCRLACVNPVDYLATLQENKSSVFKKPSAWLPWNYKEAQGHSPSRYAVAA